VAGRPSGHWRRRVRRDRKAPSVNLALTSSGPGLEAMAKSVKSTLKPFLILIVASAVAWAAAMAIHGF